MRKSILQSVVEAMKKTLGELTPERGGILGERNGVISVFYLDPSYTSRGDYVPSVDLLNDVISNWEKRGISFVGIAHSHDFGHARPSLGDKAYAEAMYENLGQTLLYPIVTKEGEETRISYYAYFHEKGAFEDVEMEILPS